MTRTILILGVYCSLETPARSAAEYPHQLHKKPKIFGLNSNPLLILITLLRQQFLLYSFVYSLEAISKSKEMMYGNKWKSFCLTFRFLGWILLCILTFGIGVLFVGPYMAVSFVQFYDDLKPKASIADKGRSVDGNDDAIAVNPTIVDDQEEEDTVIGTSSIYLEFLNGSLSGQRIMVFKDTTIGRSSENDIALSEKTISASHCRIKVVNDEFVIEDLNSTNGTFIDGQKISKQNIAQGNELQLSSIKIKVH